LFSLILVKTGLDDGIAYKALSRAKGCARQSRQGCMSHPKRVFVCHQPVAHHIDESMLSVLKTGKKTCQPYLWLNQ